MRKDKINCVHYISNFLPLTEIWIYNQIKHLHDYTPTVLARSTSNNQLFPINSIYSLLNRGNFFYWLNIIFSKLVGFIPFFYFKCKLKNTKILHVHFGYHGIKSLGLRKVLKIPMICSFYGIDAFKFPFQKRGNVKKLNKLFLDADAILVLGPFMKNSLIALGCPVKKIIIHHLGIELDKIKFVERNISRKSPLRFLLASSFVEKKGIDICLKALAKIADKIDFRVDIIGDGILREEIISLISHLDLEEKIKLQGYQTYDQMLRFAYNANAFLQASRTSTKNDKEGTPMVIVDMMATGLPVISTWHSDIPEIVKDGETGFLARENSIDSFAEKIMEFANNSNRIPEISKNCRKKVEQDFCAKEQAFKLEKIYNKVINS